MGFIFQNGLTLSGGCSQGVESVRAKLDSFWNQNVTVTCACSTEFHVTICLFLLICLKERQRPEKMGKFVLRDIGRALALLPLLRRFYTFSVSEPSASLCSRLDVPHW